MLKYIIQQKTQLGYSSTCANWTWNTVLKKESALHADPKKNILQYIYHIPHMIDLI